MPTETTTNPTTDLHPLSDLITCTADGCTAYFFHAENLADIEQVEYR